MSTTKYLEVDYVRRRRQLDTMLMSMFGVSALPVEMCERLFRLDVRHGRSARRMLRAMKAYELIA